jgi:hypothetical protein
MIHPSTMAGPNWFTANLGMTSPFQQSTTPFSRTTPFQGPQGGYGPGNTPFQTHPFAMGTNTMQMQNTINEIVRQTVPRVLASCGIQPSGVFPSQYGFQSPFGFQSQSGTTPFGQTFQTPLFGDWQTQIAIQEIARQATNQAIQNLTQQNPWVFAQGIQGSYGTTWQQPFGQQQNIANLIGQVCQAVTTSVMECLAQSSVSQGMPYSMGVGPFTGQQPFFQQQQPFFQQPFGQPPLNLGSTQTQYGFTSSGMPTGAGAF